MYLIKSAQPSKFSLICLSFLLKIEAFETHIFFLIFALFEKILVAFVPRVRSLYMQNVKLNLQNMPSYESC